MIHHLSWWTHMLFFCGGDFFFHFYTTKTQRATLSGTSILLSFTDTILTPWICHCCWVSQCESFRNLFQVQFGWPEPHHWDRATVLQLELHFKPSVNVANTDFSNTKLIWICSTMIRAACLDNLASDVHQISRTWYQNSRWPGCCKRPLKTNPCDFNLFSGFLLLAFD